MGLEKSNFLEEENFLSVASKVQKRKIVLICGQEEKEKDSTPLSNRRILGLPDHTWVHLKGRIYASLKPPFPRTPFVAHLWSREWTTNKE